MANKQEDSFGRQLIYRVDLAPGSGLIRKTIAFAQTRLHDSYIKLTLNTPRIT